MMRSTNPALNHGGWPADMSLSMDDHAQPIRMLLFIRQAWGLAEDLAAPAQPGSREGILGPAGRSRPGPVGATVDPDLVERVGGKGAGCPPHPRAGGNYRGNRFSHR